MICQQCRTANELHAKFCARCGAKLTLICPGCGKETSGDDLNCEHCGQPVVYPASGNIPGYSNQQESKSPNGTTILVLGILGLVLCTPLALVALIMAYKEIKLYPFDSQVNVGLILGWIGFAVMILSLIIGVFMGVFMILGMAAAGGSSGLFNY